MQKRLRLFAQLFGLRMSLLAWTGPLGKSDSEAEMTDFLIVGAVLCAKMPQWGSARMVAVVS